MKKIFCMVMSLAILCLCGCNSNTGDDFSSSVEVIYEEVEVTQGDDGMSSGVETVTSNDTIIDSTTPDVSSKEESGNKESSSVSSIGTPDAQETVYSLNDAEVLKNIKLNGRCQKTASGIELNFAASALEFNIDGGGALLEVKADANAYFSIFVNGKLTKERVTTADGNYIVLARNLPKGSNNIKVVRETEGGAGSTITAVSLQLDEGSKLIAKDADKVLIEFLGDSMTSGYGNIVKNGTQNAADLKNQNSLKAYPYLVASQLGLDYRIVSMSGIALKERVGSNYTKPPFYDFYSLENYYKSTTEKYKSSDPKDVDIVCINLGSNDIFSQLLKTDDPASVEEYAQLYTDLITKIGYRTDVKIVFVSGVMSCHSHSKAYEGAKAKLSAKGYNNVYLYDAESYESGGDGHPSAEEHKLVADALVKFFKANNIA